MPGNEWGTDFPVFNHFSFHIYFIEVAYFIAGWDIELNFTEERMYIFNFDRLFPFWGLIHFSLSTNCFSDIKYEIISGRLEKRICSKVYIKNYGFYSNIDPRTIQNFVGLDTGIFIAHVKNFAYKFLMSFLINALPECLEAVSQSASQFPVNNSIGF